MPEGFFTEATTNYWQEVMTGIPPRFAAVPPFRFGYPVRLPGRKVLILPLRQLPTGDTAVASLIANQAGHSVVATLADHMAVQAKSFDPEIIVGLPTLGLAFAGLIAARLGQPRYVPLGYSRKFWYSDALSESVSSITSPETGKQLRLDPNLLPLIVGRRVVLVDDAISTGNTAVAAITLLHRIGVQVVCLVVAMKQTNRWEAALDALPSNSAVRAVFGCPLFRQSEDGWWPIQETMPSVP